VQASPDGGKIAIFARNLVVEAEQNPLLKPGKYILITVQDWGIGIKTENLVRIFDPYFSTKETGTGLGLSICYSIIKKHDGLIMVESTEGVGTTFTVYLPAALDSVTEEDEN
jgi:signal transduction histidine kinase